MISDVQKRKGKGAMLLQVNLSISKQTVVLLALLFLSARANIGGMIPFGLPACAAWLFSEECARWPLNRILYIVALVLGSASLGHPMETGVVASAIILFTCCAALLSDQEKTVRRSFRTGAAMVPSVRLGLLLLLCVFVPSVVFLAGTDATFSDFLRLLVQMVIMFVAFYIYCHARNGLYARKNAAVLTQEQFSGLCIGAVVVLMGLPEIIIAGISTMHVIAICLILFVAWVGGFGAGAACGTVAGVLMASGNAVYMCMYALGGFLAGLLNRFRRVGAVLGFVIANILLACIAGGARELILGMYETGFAAFLFLLLPRKPLRIFDIPMLRGFLAKANPGQAGEKPSGTETAPLLGENYIPTGLMIGQTAGRVSDLSRIGEEIAKNAELLFEYGAQKEAETGETCVMQIYGKVCARCAMRESCWNDDYSGTYGKLQHLALCVEQNNEKDMDDMIAEMVRFCPHTERIRTECRRVTSLLRAERIWRSRNWECRRAAALQLSGISRMIHRTGEELDEQRKIYYELRDRVHAHMEQADVTLCDFSCRLTRSNHLEIRLSMPKSTLLPCGVWSQNPGTGTLAGRCGNCMTASKVLSSVTGASMEATCLCGCEQNICTVLFSESRRFSAAFGIASTKAHQSEKSGDCFSKFQLEDGSLYAVLSDGLGTGLQAAKQSGTCLKLIRLFLEGGLTFGEAAETVDLLIAASGDGETVSAAVDALYLDLYSGIAHFAKRGAAPSYLLRPESEEWKEISMAEAPLGFHGSGGSNVRESVTHGCVIVMLSDGISDAFVAGANGDEQTLPRFLLSIFRNGVNKADPINMNRAAQLVLNRAISLSSGKPKDDMTVAAVRITEKV